LEGNKDADDLAFIINNYLTINEDRALEDHYDIYEVEDFDIRVAGAKLLGRDLKVLLGKYESTRDKILAIISNQINLGVESPLINQIIETHVSYDYELVFQCLTQIAIGLYGD